MPFLIEVSDGFPDGAVQFIGVGERPMRQMMPLEIAPAHFDVVEFRRVTRQPLDSDPRTRGERCHAGFRGVDWAVVEHQDNWFPPPARSWPEASIKLFQQRDEVRAPLRGRGVHDEFTARRVEHADDRDLTRLTWCGDAKIGASFGPGMGEIRMGQRFGFIAEQQNDVTSLGLLAAQLKTQPDTLDLTGVLTPLQRVPRPAPAEPPFCLSRTLRREREMRVPV